MKPIEKIANLVGSIVMRHSPTGSTITVDHRENRIEIRTNAASLPPAKLVWSHSIIRLIELGLLRDVLDAPLTEDLDWYAMRIGSYTVAISFTVPAPENILFPQKPSLALIAIGGSSGAGKTSVMQEMEKLRPGFLRRYVAFTTRQARAIERDGVEYHFRASDEFERMRQDPRYANFVEARGNWYWIDPYQIFKGIWRGHDKTHVFFISQRHDFEQRQRWFPSLRWFWLDVSEEVARKRLTKRGDTDIEESLQYNRRLLIKSREDLITMRFDSDTLRPREIAATILVVCDEEIRRSV